MFLKTKNTLQTQIHRPAPGNYVVYGWEHSYFTRKLEAARHQFEAIINPPQCAILALGATQAVAVVQEERITKALCMTATLSLDHRVLDGISGARFLSALKVALENPEGLFKEAV